MHAPELALRVGLELRLDHADDDLVADEAAGVHNLLGLLAQLGAGLDLLAEHVARGEVADLVLFLDVGCLGSLACGAREWQSDAVSRRVHRRRVSPPMPELLGRGDEQVAPAPSIVADSVLHRMKERGKERAPAPGGPMRTIRMC